MRKRKSKALSEINITSLVDVMLVLLIIFMITAPFIRAGMKVDLPNAEIRDKQPKKSVVIIVNQFGQVYFEGKNLNDEELGKKAKDLHAVSPDISILVEGDEAAPYGRIISVMDVIRRAGYENVGLVLETIKKR
jgi:biopolymer transport protein TolR